MGTRTYTYILNAIYYCLWRYDIGITRLIGNIVDVIFFVAVTLLLPLKYKTKALNKLKNNRKEYMRRCNNKVSGLCINSANYWLGYWYSSYFTVFSFPLTAIVSKFGGDFSPYSLVLFPLPVILGAIPQYRAVYHKDRYLQYFEEFEKEGAQWHKKWKRIAILFCVGGIFMVFLGMCLMALILKE